MYFTILVIIHIGGAIIGIGPSFAFGVLGSMADKGDDATKLILFRALRTIDSRLLTPVALITQPLTGVLLIFDRKINVDFFSTRHVWLIVAIVLYIIILFMSYVISRPRVRRMISLLESGEGQGEEFKSLEATSKMLGPIFGLLTTAIVILMIWKPGSGCGVQIC
ncbi:MAG TPA: DUF2269 family protein [Actinomycetota bacterium]|nr:DUF2269 family protein [Actinomycetota bacterium]